MRRKRNQFGRKHSHSNRPASGGLHFGERQTGVHIARIRMVLGWVCSILMAIVLAGVCVYFFAIRIPVVGQSMNPTLEGDETVLVNRFVYKLIDPKPNDLIVFLPNGNEKSHYYIKRVIAVPGDTVQIIDGKVYVNGEAFAEEIDDSYIENGLLAQEPIVVGEDEFFVLGDNRNNSEDSRYANIGNVKKEDILGKAWFIVSPLRKFGVLE